MRLIDADALKKDLKSVTLSNGTLVNTNAVLYLLEEYPTAYDPDKVVEQLEKEKNPLCRADGSLMGERAVIGIDKAIQIVKGSGSDLALECKWKLEDEEVNLYATGCNEYHLLCEGTPEENKYRYCPYCGKKIKEAVV